MMTNRRAIGILVAIFAIALVPSGPSAHAIEVKKSLYSGSSGGGGGGSGGGPAPKNPLTREMQQKLVETVSDEAQKYMSDESEKKADGQTYVDLDSAKMKYIPQESSGKMTVTCRLEAAEYKPKKDASGRGTATGKRKALVFKYQLDGQKWTEVEQPKWEDVAVEGKGKKGGAGGGS